jgi:hypothetical protein
MDPDLALTALRHAVEHDEDPVVVADIDWAGFVPVFTLARHRPLLSDLPEVRAILDMESAGAGGPETPDAAGFAVRLVGLSAADQDDALLSLVRSHAAAVLGHATTDSVQPGKALKDLGFDSLTAVEVRNRLAAATGLKLRPTVVFDHPTPTALAAHLRALLLPEGPTPDERIRAALGRMEADLPDLPDGSRDAIGVRLRALLAEVERGESAGDLDAASDDELFELLDNELGLA